VRSAKGVHLVVRCHPAETPGAYLKLAGSAPNITVAPADIDLAATLAVAGLVVTVNSTVALEAMALGVPALALNLPNYLSPFVEAGVMLGCSSPGEIAPLLQRFLLDDGALAGLRTRQQEFMAEYAMLPTGEAAVRAVAAILDLARSSGGLP
jgi:glycosyltransferase involved in cell wall biosynthesis